MTLQRSSDAPVASEHVRPSFELAAALVPMPIIDERRLLHVAVYWTWQVESVAATPGDPSSSVEELRHETRTYCGLGSGTEISRLKARDACDRIALANGYELAWNSNTAAGRALTPSELAERRHDVDVDGLRARARKDGGA